MKYYLGEIYVTHRKILWWWVEYTEKFSTTLIIAQDWLTARDKCREWHDERAKEIKGRYRTTYTIAPAI